VDAYLDDWFLDGPGNTRFFAIPAVSVSMGRTQFISGRHRTAVLLRHLDYIPLSFDMRQITDADCQWIYAIVSTPIETHTLMNLPDLPIRSSLP